MNNVVRTLIISGTDLYAGGDFTTAGRTNANFIAKWDGSSWSVLGSGMNDIARALAISGTDLYAGGGFTTAGGKLSPYIARAYLLPLPELSVHRSGLDVVVSWPSADSAGFALEQTASVSAPTMWISNRASVTDNATNKSIAVPATNSSQFFRLRKT